ncbi:3-carboxymuconate cyclase [Cordyceps fumosorosea ARSEF 2679]|uniref:3-carboxymuconate cyclase n=1 Tax=Cordyceps fumosorosea (strain ARSEF 2679) TaxID=1081104 RepID=A0A168AKD8_CORFA|nr:3-carboxymuconate cyclase [Cordyceps fumosorosea ARSEF 2679]OAA68870.1 3-carboxymuconate cyclase [Cordyceps fumosorosea ARSEF 2679]
MALISLASLLLLAGSAAANPNILYVTSYAGTITTLNLTETTPPAGGKYPSVKAVATSDGCKASPSWLTLKQPCPMLYCIDEGLETPGGSLSSYRTNDDGTLTQIGKVTTAPGPVSGVFYGAKGHGFAMAHYGGSTLSTWDVSDPANIKNVQSTKFTEPAGPNPQQNAPHPHEAVLDPTGRFLVVPDLGADLVRLFSLDNQTLQATALPPVKAKPGSGPRHVAFAVHGAKTYLYLITELGNTIVGYDVGYEGAGISLKEIFDIGVHGEGRQVPDKAAASEIVVSPDQKFLVASSRRENIYKVDSFDDKTKQIDSDSIINFSIDAGTGKLTFLQDVPSGGSFPRHFSMNKAGTKIAIGLQKDSRVVVMQRDPATGKLGDFESFANIAGEITSVIFDE